jgi:tagaturonate reductase
MELLQRAEIYTQKLPIKIVQFGDGNFLRGFADYIIDKLNNKAGFNAGVAIVKARAGGSLKQLQDQEGLFTLFTKGISQGKEIQHKNIISCIQKAINPYEDYNAFLNLAKEEELTVILSNTTEAGIAFNAVDALLTGYPHQSFPAKVTALLYHRYVHFNGDTAKGLTLLPLELITDNANRLKELVLQYAALWGLGHLFCEWVDKHNFFHNTLVDRIVPGYPKDEAARLQQEAGYEDRLMVVSEAYLFWAIEADETLLERIPFSAIDANIIIVKDIAPYRLRKVRILNGAHTLMVPVSLLYGNETVSESIADDFVGKFIRDAVYHEINPTINLPEETLNSFSEDVFDRFSNPFIRHELSSIALNSVSKFKVRVLPTILDYQKKYNRLPLRLIFGFACLIRFYKGEWKGAVLPVIDEPIVIEAFTKAFSLSSIADTVYNILSIEVLWGSNLLEIEGLQTNIIIALQCLDSNDLEQSFTAYLAIVNKTKNT